MKVLNLRCANAHGFEGWFASEDDYARQHAGGHLACPLCDDRAIERLPSAPRLNVSGARAQAAPSPAGPVDRAGEAQARWLHAMREVLRRTEDVGDRFPEEARRIHYGESEERGIRGRASREDAQALRDEGIEVVAVALPEALKGPLQ